MVISKLYVMYVADVLNHCSNKTLWRIFESCNNYRVPDPVPKINTTIHYWYSDGEEKQRKNDILYMRNHFPETDFRTIPDLGHGGLVLLKPELFSDMIRNL